METIITETNRITYKNLVLSGGSIKGISTLGAIQHLINEGLLDLKNLRAIAGTSVGSMIALFIVLDFSIEEIWQFILCIDIKKMFEPNLLNFINYCGADNGRLIYDIIENIITKKIGIKHINFKQLYDITKIHLTVVGTCLTTKEVVYYDYINTPTFKVSMAVRISIGLPGFFMPITIDNKKYIDGGLTNNYPINLFEDKLNETIGIQICCDYNTEYTWPEEFFMAIFNLFMHNYYKKMELHYPNNTIVIKDSIDGITMYDFDISNDIKFKLYQKGIDASKEFIKKIREKTSNCNNDNSINTNEIEITTNNTDQVARNNTNDIATISTNEITTNNTDEAVTNNTDEAVTNNTDEAVTNNTNEIVTSNVNSDINKIAINNT